MVAEADYCWFVGWGFTGARPSSQQVKPNDLARVLQQSRHYLMQHDTCNQILDEWNIDKKVLFSLKWNSFLMDPKLRVLLINRSIFAPSDTRSRPTLATRARVTAVDHLSVATRTNHGSLPVSKSDNRPIVARRHFNASRQFSRAFPYLRIGLTK